MSADWYPGIKAFSTHWRHAPMLQQTSETLEREFPCPTTGFVDHETRFHDRQPRLCRTGDRQSD